MTRFPSDESRANYENARQRQWDAEHQTESATSLTEVMTIIRDLAAANYEDRGMPRFVYYSFDFFLSKLTDFKLEASQGGVLPMYAAERALHRAFDSIVEQLFDESELAWFARTIHVDGDRCSISVDICHNIRY